MSDMTQGLESLKIRLGSAIAHGTYMTDDAREKEFEEIIAEIETYATKRVIEELKTELGKLEAVLSAVEEGNILTKDGQNGYLCAINDMRLDIKDLESSVIDWEKKTDE